jgi:hypothetical protein
VALTPRLNCRDTKTEPQRRQDWSTKTMPSLALLTEEEVTWKKTDLSETGSIHKEERKIAHPQRHMHKVKLQRRCLFSIGPQGWQTCKDGTSTGTSPQRRHISKDAISP